MRETRRLNYDCKSVSACEQIRRNVEPVPAEERTGVGLAIERDVAVSDDGLEWERRGERREQRVERHVLRVGKWFEVRAFEFNADREIVAAGPALERRGTGVPGALETGHELRAPPRAINEEMGRDSRIAKTIEDWVLAGLDAICEQALDLDAAIATRRKTDVVYDD